MSIIDTSYEFVYLWVRFPLGEHRFSSLIFFSLVAKQSETPFNMQFLEKSGKRGTKCPNIRFLWLLPFAGQNVKLKKICVTLLANLCNNKIKHIFFYFLHHIRRRRHSISPTVFDECHLSYTTRRSDLLL